MKMLIFAAALIFSLASQAKDMSGSEGPEAYKDMPDGSSVYIGKCDTHENYSDLKFRVSNVVQEYIWTKNIDAKRMKDLISFDAKLWDLVLDKSDAKEIMGKDITPEQALTNYFDDITVDWIETFEHPHKNYLRFNLGVGGGNGLILVIEQSLVGNASYKLMSKTMDGDVEFCDNKVWNKN